MTPVAASFGLLPPNPIRKPMQLLLILASLLAPADESADQQYHRDLVDLASKCTELDLDDQAEITRNWAATQRADQIDLYIPISKSTTLSENAPQLVKFWHERFLEIRSQYAERLFNNAVAICSEDPGRAYKLLYQTLRENPNHMQALTALELDTQSNVKVTKPGVIHSRTTWPARTYWRLESRYFVIDTNKSREAAEHIHAELVALEAAWKQVFYSYWADPTALAKRLEGEDVSLAKHRNATRKHRIIVFDTRSQYASFLDSKGSNATASLGLYDDKSQTSYFFIDDLDTRDTWLHEVTHQFFQERGPGVLNIGRNQNTMLVEGIAMYMESLREVSGHITLGGWESNRLQFARYYRLNGQFHMPAKDLMALGMSEIQGHQSQGEIYYEAAGLVHSLMNSESAKASELRSNLIEVISGIYHGKDTAQDLATTVAPWDWIEENYVPFLVVSDQDVSNLDSGTPIRNLVLAQSPVTDDSLKIIGKYKDLNWLDLTYSNVTDDGVQHLSSLSNIRKISFEGTKISNSSAGILSNFPDLIELDFSNTPISDDAVAQITRKTKLEVLYLTGTKITDEGLNKLASLRNLEVLDVRKTNVSDAAVEQLMKMLPKLQR